MKLPVTLATLMFVVNSLAADIQAIAKQDFVGRTGKRVNLEATLNDRKAMGSLVFFWANWCVPCKEEMKLLMQHQSELKGFRVVAINVDEAGDYQKAKSFLKGIKWSYDQWHDPAGEYFYQIRPSGALPFGLWVSNQGKMQTVFNSVDENTISRLAQMPVPKATDNEQKLGFKLAQKTFVRQQKDLTAQDDDEALAASSQFSYSSTSWQVQATHNLLGQKPAESDVDTEWEDELGKSYVQWQDQNSRMRVGDQDVDYFSGQLLSARELPVQKQSSGLMGLHTRLGRKTWQLDFSGGKVRNFLFGTEVNPANDISISLPEEYAGAMVGKWIPLSQQDQSMSMQLGVAAYQRQQDSDLGFNQAHRDNRVAASVEYDRGSVSSRLSGVRYFILEGEEQAKEVNPHIVDWAVAPAWQASEELRLTFNGNVQQFKNLPERSRNLALVEENSLPLDSSQVRTWKINSRIELSKTSWALDPVYIDETALKPDERDSQKTYSLAVSQLEYDFRAGALVQDLQSQVIDQQTREWVFSARGRPVKMVSLGAIVKTHDARKLTEPSVKPEDSSGQSRQGLIGLDFSEMFAVKEFGTLTLTTTGTLQDGYYLGYSGLSKKRLLSQRLQWSYGELATSAAWGQEPGGIVCANGVCARREPLNGFAFDMFLVFSL